jgi:hypothetical protein
MKTFYYTVIFNQGDSDLEEKRNGSIEADDQTTAKIYIYDMYPQANFVYIHPDISQSYNDREWIRKDSYSNL